jgi:hypothetical protein
MEKLPTETGDYRRSNAAGQYFGYALQAIRMCHYLQTVRKDICEVTLEGIEDIEVYVPNEGWILEQCKSGLSHNPVADWASDLWKTFAHWIKLVDAKRIDPKLSQFRLYLVQNKTGNYVSKLNDAKKNSDIRELIDEIKCAAEEVNPTGAMKYINQFLTCDHEVLYSIIKNFQFRSGNSNPYYHIESELELTVSPRMLNEVVVCAVGWVTNQANEKIVAKQRATLLRSDYRTWLQNYLQQNDRNHLLPTIQYTPENSEITDVINSFPVFIQQLEFLEAHSDDKLRATTDYMKAFAQKTQWAALGFVQEDSFEKYQEELKVEWGFNKTDIEIKYSNNTLEQQGKLLLTSCLRNQNKKIDFKPLPDFYSRGEYHNLAGGEGDESDAVIGWHPMYEDKLRGR